MLNNHKHEKDVDQKVHRMQQINKKADKTVLESWQ